MSDAQLVDYALQLSWIYYAVCLAGIALLAAVAFGVARVVKTAALGRYRDSAMGLSDLLNAAAEVDNGVIVCKNGGFMAAWAYEGSDASSMTVDARNFISERLNQLFASLDDGTMIHIDAVRTPIPVYPGRHRSFFPDRVSAAIDQQRRNFFTGSGTSYDSTFVLTLTWLPPRLTDRKLRDMMFTGKDVLAGEVEKTRALVNEFKSRAENFESSLRVIFPRVARLKTMKGCDASGREFYYDYFLSWLYFALTGIQQKIIRPETPVYLDTILAAQDYYAGITPRIGRNYIKVIAIEGLAGATTPGMLSVLNELPCRYRLSTRFIFMDRNEAKAHMNALRRKWNQKTRGFFAQLFDNPNARLNMDAVNMVAEADAILTHISEGSTAFGFLSQNLVIMDEDPEVLKEQVKMLLQNIQHLGLTGRVEEINANDAFFGSLPGHGYENIRRPMVSTANLADLIPVSTPWIGLENNPCDFYPENSPALMQCVTGASDSTVFRLNFHVKDLAHTLVLGPTGAGKSTFLCMAAASCLRYPDMEIFCFDKGMSMYALCEACGGSHFIPASGDSSLAFCPLGSIEDSSDLAWASDWIQSIMILNNQPVTSKMVNAINDALGNMLDNRRQARARGTEFLMTITAFSSLVQDQDVRVVLQQYTAGSAQGALIDAESDNLSMSRFSVFEIEPLMNLGEKYSLPVLLYLFRRIEKALHGQPAFIFLDEAWLLLDNPAFSAKIREWLKVMRKNNTGVVMATQSLADLAGSNIFPVLVESTATKIFLPNPSAGQEEAGKLYRALGLNEQQINLIAEGVKKVDYFVVSGHNSRMVRLALSKFELAFAGVSSRDDVQMIKDLKAKYGYPGWIDEWLKYRSVSWPEGLIWQEETK